MSESVAPAPDGNGEQPAETTAARLALMHRAGGIVTPLITVVFAFFVGGLVVLGTTGKNPLTTYKAIFDGSGLNWLLPWQTCGGSCTAALNFQQTLIIWIPLALTGLAVAFAFRCGMFNIGGQGQYLVGAIFSVWVGSSFTGMPAVLHVLLTIVVACLAGAIYGGLAGLLKATVGAHEVITTIMLNWIAVWVGIFLFGLGGPLQNTPQPWVPVSSDVAESAKLHVFWGDPVLQGLHIGLFAALGALVVFWVTLNRTTLGYEVRAVGFNPEAARYGGINVSRNYFLAMAISGTFAGLAGSLDILGWQFRLNVNDIQVSSIGFIGIAVALLGRNTAIGTGLAALLFASLVTGTSTRNLDPSIFRPELASNLTLLIQGLVVLFVGADVLILYLWGLRRKVGLAREAAK